MESIFTHIILVITVAIINIISANCINKRISKFNSELKRNEITFSRYNQLQIEALKSIYNKLVDFHYSNSRLFYNRSETITIKQYRKCIDDWVKCFYKLAYTVSNERIFLPEDLKEKYCSIIKSYETMKMVLIDDKNNIFDEFEPYLVYEEYDINFESNLLWQKINNMRKEDDFVEFENNIKKLRKEIEVLFMNIN